MGKLKRQGREDDLNVTPAVGFLRAKETGAKGSICEASLGERLGDCRFSGSRDAVEPEDGFALLDLQPIMQLQEDTLPRSLQAPLSAPGTVVGLDGMIHPAQKESVHVPLFTNHCVARH